MLIPFPVAFWTGALITDGIGAFTHDPFWFRMSVVLIAMGSVAGFAAAIAGYIDYRTAPMTRKAQSLADGHLKWSLGTIVLYPIAWALRAQDHASLAGIAVSIAGSALLFVSAFLGSELTNRHKVGITEEPAPSR